MKHPLSVLLIEDEQIVCDSFRYTIEEYPDIHLVAVTNKISEGISFTKKYIPNVILLDLELHNGEGNGLIFLKELQNISLEIKPYILITTNNSSQSTYRFARQLGADMIMYKYQNDYTEKNVIDFLAMIGDMLLENQYSSTAHSSSTPSPFEERQSIRRQISRELDCLEMSPKIVGYQYLIDAIVLFMDNSNENICKVLAKKYHKTPGSVDRGMRNAINSTWNKTSPDILFTHYTGRVSSDKGTPTVMEFISYFARKFKCK